jgi:uncharacterized membrane protein
MGRKSMNLDPWLQLVHAASAVVWIGGNGLLALVGIRVRRRGDPAAIGRFADTLMFVGVRVIAPAALLVLVSGLWLVLESSEWSVTQPWILLALGVFALAVILSLVFLNRGATRLQQVSTGVAPDGRAADQALGRLLLGYGLVLATLVLALLDMALKPGS